MTDQERIAIWNWSMTARVSGIPSRSYVYDFKGDYKNSLDHLHHKIIPYGDLLLSASNKDGLVIFNRKEGVIVDRLSCSRCINGMVNNRHNGKCLFIDPYIVDLETLEIAHDPWPAFDAYGIEPRPRGRGFITGHYAIRELNPDKYPGHWWVLDLNTWKETIQDVGASWPGWMFYDQGQVVCKAKENLQIRRISDMAIISEKEVPGFSTAIGNQSGIKLSFSDCGGCYLDDRTLNVIGTLNDEDCVGGVQFSDFSDRFSPLSVFTESCSDGDIFHCYHWKSKLILWRKKFNKFNQNYIAGDLIFASADGDRVLAIDKWTGDIVWEAEDPYQPWSIHFYEKDVYFMDMGGNMRCYQWDEEYISPHRPKDPNMAWIRPE